MARFAQPRSRPSTGVEPLALYIAAMVVQALPGGPTPAGPAGRLELVVSESA